MGERRRKSSPTKTLTLKSRSSENGYVSNSSNTASSGHPPASASFGTEMNVLAVTLLPDELTGVSLPLGPAVFALLVLPVLVPDPGLVLVLVLVLVVVVVFVFASIVPGGGRCMTFRGLGGNGDTLGKVLTEKVGDGEGELCNSGSILLMGLEEG